LSGCEHFIILYIIEKPKFKCIHCMGNLIIIYYLLFIYYTYAYTDYYTISVEQPQNKNIMPVIIRKKRPLSIIIILQFI